MNFHAEMAGEGIEYSWGVTKGLYRCKPLNSKRSKEAFKWLGLECTSRDILRTATVRKPSRRARAYICAYYSLYESKQNGGDNIPTLALPLIERLVRHSKLTGQLLTSMPALLMGLYLISREVLSIWTSEMSDNVWDSRWLEIVTGFFDCSGERIRSTASTKFFINESTWPYDMQAQDETSSTMLRSVFLG